MESVSLQGGWGVNIKREKKTESLRWQIIIESN